MDKTQKNIATNKEIGDKALEKTITDVKEKIETNKEMFPLIFYWTGKMGAKKNIISIGESDISISWQDFFSQIGHNLANKHSNIKVFVVAFRGLLNLPFLTQDAVFLQAITIDGKEKEKSVSLKKEENNKEEEFLTKVCLDMLNKREGEWTSIYKKEAPDEGPLALPKILFVSYKFNLEFSWLKKYKDAN